MFTIKPSVLRHQAGEVLQNSTCDPKKLVLLHTAIALGASLLVSALNYFLSLQIDGTGGLSGIGLRVILSTIQTALELAVMIALPFWEIGLLFAALCWSRKETVNFQSLLQGFRRFGPVLALRFLEGGLFLAIGFALLNVGTTVYLLTPLSKPLLEILEPVIKVSDPQLMESLLTPELMNAAVEACMPLLLIFGLLYALISIPFFYRLRFSKFAVMDGSGALNAMVLSFRATKRKSLQLVKLDLSFWWFYLLQALCVAICYGDTVLRLLGIALPISPDAAFFLFYALGALCQGLLLWQYQATVLTTYGIAYAAFGMRPLTPREQSLPHTVTYDV